MKNVFFFVTAFGLLIAFSGCKKENIPGPDNGIEIQQGGIDKESIEAYQGEVGIIISTREIARKGYQPAYARVEVSGNTFDTAGTVPIDDLTNLTYVYRKLEDLTEAQRQELKENGVNIAVEVFNQNQQLLGTAEREKVFFTSSPEKIEVPTTLEDKYKGLIQLRPGVNHHVQIVDKNTNQVKFAPGAGSYTNSSNSNSMIFNRTSLDYSQNPPSDTYTQTAFRFTEVPGEQGVFTIAYHAEGMVLYWYIRADNRVGVQNKYNWGVNGGETNAAALAHYKFRIEQVAPGSYTFRSLKNNNLLTLAPDQRLSAGNASPNPDQIAYFRILALDIDWDFTPLDYRQLQPVLPPAKTDFAFNSTLVNCSSGSLEQVVGREQTKETTLTSSWEESMSVSVSSEFSLSVTNEAEVSASFYGASASASQSVTSSLSVGVSATQTSTIAGESSSTKTVTVSSQRTITVPSKKATVVSDIYQTYTNIEIPYVQRFKVAGTYPGGEGPLSGKEILTQLNFNSFSGVVTEVGSTYVVVTVRGTNRIDELIDTKTVAEDVPADCD